MKPSQSRHTAEFRRICIKAARRPGVSVGDARPAHAGPHLAGHTDQNGSHGTATGAAQGAVVLGSDCPARGHRVKIASGVAARSSLNLDPAPAHKGVGACENDGPEQHGKWARCCRTRLQHRADPDQRLGSIATPYAREVALSPRVVSASEWVPARKELQATEEEAVRALWQIADDTGR